MPYSKESYVEVSNPQDASVIKDLCNKVMKDELFGFLQVYIHVPNDHDAVLQEKFSKFSPLFIIVSIPKDQIPQYMKDYQERTERLMIWETKKLLRVTRATEILLYTPMVKWYLSHRLKVNAIHKYLKYESSHPFSWFPKEVSSARLDGDNDPILKQLRDAHKIKGNSHYRKMIKDLMKHVKMTFMINKDLVDKACRSPYFEDLE